MKPSLHALRALLVAFGLAVAACDTAPSTSSPQREAAAPALHVEDAEPGGEVDAVVKKALASASARRRRVVVYVGATWCEPCQRFHRAAQAGELNAQFPDLDILAFDADRDGERLGAAGYTWKKYIPLFALPGDDGRASGRQFEGAIKGDGAVSYLVPRLQALLAQ
jgi:thiol-disulfide isomerase/thioredoxin